MFDEKGGVQSLCELAVFQKHWHFVAKNIYITNMSISIDNNTYTYYTIDMLNDNSSLNIF